MNKKLRKTCKLCLLSLMVSAVAYGQKKANPQASAQETTQQAHTQKDVTTTTPDNYMQTVNKLKTKSGWINHRNFDIVRGIEGYVKGVWATKSHVYIMIELRNTTNVNYDVDNISFISNPIKDGKKQLRTDEQIYAPVWQTDLSVLERKSKQKLIFVFTKFTIDDKKNLLFIMEETEGERTLILKIKPEYIIEAKYISITYDSRN